MSILERLGARLRRLVGLVTPSTEPATKGDRGEDLAAAHLREHGLTIVARNVEYKIGEIDIIARDGDCLVYVEVKSRASRRFGLPVMAVHYHKQRRLVQLAKLDSARRKHAGPVRLDIIGIVWEDPPEIRWYRNAIWDEA